MHEEQLSSEHSAVMHIIGVGGAGGNAVERLNLESVASFVERAVVDTDIQALSRVHVCQGLPVGAGLLHGLSAGGDPDLGKQAADESSEALRSLVQDAPLVVLIAGLGGGTGGGVAPVLARHACEHGAMVLAFAPLPFTFEGARRQQEAKNALLALQSECDAVITLPNASLLQQQEGSATVLEAFDGANRWIERAICSLAALLFKPGVVNVDFTSLRNTFEGSTGRTLFGLGKGEGEHAAKEALEDLLLCPLLHLPDSAKRADRILVSITAGTSIEMNALNELMASITETFSSKDQAEVGIRIDDELGAFVEVCVLGVAVDKSAAPKMSSSAPISRAEAEDVAVAVHTPKNKRRLKGASGAAREQEEFTFLEVEANERGYFNKTEENLYNGEDLDVPTYLRKGIKVSLK